jgi:hypothetical protein
MTDDLTSSMVDTLSALQSATRNEVGMRWTSTEGLSAHKGSIYALERRGLVIWDAYRCMAMVTSAGWEMAEVAP